MSHVLSANARGEVATTQEWAARKVASMTSLTIDQAHEALRAFYDVAWGVLLQGHRLRLGEVGSVAVCWRRGTVATLVSANDGEEFTTQTRPNITLRGRISAPFREAWYDQDQPDQELDDA